MNRYFGKSIFLVLLLFSSAIAAEIVEVTVTVPEMDTSPYHRPYVAVWVETAEREGVHTIAVWHEQGEWLRDMRQWWRKLGRKKQPSYDAVTGATRKPGQYSLSWNLMDTGGNKIPPGEYYISVEAAREEGGRSYLRQKVVLGKNQKQEYSQQGDIELGRFTVRVIPQ